jgi:hypothetical protein
VDDPAKGTDMPKITCSIDGCEAAKFSRGWCSRHYSRWQRHGDPLIETRTPPIAAGATEKYCPKCSETKPLTEFGTRPNGRPTGYCSLCMSSYHSEYAQTDKGKAAHKQASGKWSSGPRKTHDLRKRYGIGLDEYEALLAKQGGCCAICGAEEPKSGRMLRLNVDHCHSTGTVRGLLCTNCNHGIGKFKDDPALMSAAIAYLKAAS